MILNSYAVLDAFVSFLRFGLVLAAVWVGVTTWRRWRRAGRDPGQRDAAEDGYYLLILLAGVLLALNLLAWPLFYLLLQSYVPQWPGVMCVYGVTRVGAGSVGPSRHLPALLAVLQVTKPLLVFLSGAWFVAHLVNRRTPTAPLTGRVVLLLGAAGVLAGADAAAEVAYLVIPKKDDVLTGGCCTTLADGEHGPGRFLPPKLVGADAAAWLYPAYFAANGVAAVVLVGVGRACRRRAPAGWSGPVAALAGVTLVVNWVFLTEIAAPRLLHLPDHHCPYDLVSASPPGVAAVVLFVGASFAAGWGCWAARLGRAPGAGPAAAGLAGALFHAAALGYAASVLVLTAAVLTA